MRCIPSSSREGLSWGQPSLAEASGKGPAIRHQLLGCWSTLCRRLEAGDKSARILSFAGLFFLLIINTSMNKGRLVRLSGVGVVLRS